MRDNTKNKRKYTKPELERMGVDNEISMLSGMSGLQTDPTQSSVNSVKLTKSASTQSTGLKSISTSSSADQVFGGSSVDYE